MWYNWKRECKGRTKKLKTGSKEGDCETATDWRGCQARLLQRQRHFKTELCVLSRCAKRAMCQPRSQSPFSTSSRERTLERGWLNVLSLDPQRIQYLPLYGVVLTLYFVSPFFILTIKRFVIYFLAHYKTKNLYNYCNFLINALQLHEFIFTYLQTISSLPFGMLRNFRRWTWGLFQWSHFWHLTLSSWCLVNCFSLNNIFSNRSLVQKTDWKVSSF